MPTHADHFIGIEGLEIDAVSIGAFRSGINIYFAVPTTMRIVGFKNGLTPSIEDGHVEILRVKT